MNSDMTGRGKWNKVTSRRGKMLDGVAAGKKATACAVFTDGTFDAACVFTYLNHRLQEKTGNNYHPQWSAAVNALSHLIKLGKARWWVLRWDQWWSKLPYLVHTVQELQENRREAASLGAGTQVATLAELVAEGQPLFLQQHLETL